MNTRERISFNTVLFMAGIGVVITALVLGAVVMDALGPLIGGIAIVFLGISILAAIGVWLFRLWADAKVKIDSARYDFILGMADKGALPTSGEYEWRRQIAPAEQKQITAPVNGQGVSQIIFNQNALRESAVNLLLFSMRQCGSDQNRIASGPECAAAGVNGYTPRTWSKIVHEFLEPRYGVVTARGAIDNGGGTFVPDTYGTVEALYHKIMTDSAVDALPGVER